MSPVLVYGRRSPWANAFIESLVMKRHDDEDPATHSAAEAMWALVGELDRMAAQYRREKLAADILNSMFSSSGGAS